MTGPHRLTIEWPTRDMLTSNRRRDRREHARITAKLRAFASAEAHVLGQHDAATIVVRTYHPTAARHDALNVAPTIKPLVDGLVDAGVLPDDDDDHLTGPFLLPGRETSGARGVTRLEFTLLPGRPRFVLHDIEAGRIYVDALPVEAA